MRELIEITQAEGEKAQRRDGVKMTAAEREREIAKLEKEMRAAAKQMEYEYAAVLRDRIIELRGKRTESRGSYETGQISQGVAPHQAPHRGK